MKKVIFISIIYLLSGISLLSLIYCRGKSPKEPANENALETYTGTQKAFKINIPGKHDVKESSGEGYRLVELTAADEEGITLHVIRVRIIEGESDLFHSSYESTFLSNCKCSIIERGSIHFAGKPARHYTVSLRNGEWIGYQRHFAGRGKMFILSVSGPRDDSKNLHLLYDQVTANFVILEN